MPVLNKSDESAASDPVDDELTTSTDSTSSFLGELGQRFSLRLGAQIVWGVLVLLWLVGGNRLDVLPLIMVGVVTGILFVPELAPMAIVRVLRDWFVVLLWIFGWGVSRNAVDALGMPIQEQIWIDIDLLLGFGELPNHRLQRLIDWDSPPKLWEATLSFMYISHFLVGFGVLIILYYRDRVVWGLWWRRYVLVGSIGLFFYILIPSAPPWMSSENGTIAMVYEGIPRGWEAIQTEWLHNLFEFGRDKANPVAAMPSLHAAFPVTLYLFFAPRCGRLMRSVMAFYALYMGFVIVISGQHWVIDVFAGWLTAWVAHTVLERFEKRRADKQTAEEQAELADAEESVDQATVDAQS